MGAKIHLYPLERFTFGDDDYYDIDYFDGLIYQTAKIKGSTIKAGILAGIQTFYNADGTLINDRVVDADLNALTFNNLRKLVFNVNTAPIGQTGIELNVIPVGALLKIKDATANEIRLEVTQNGSLRVNDAFELPLVDGAPGQVLTTDGAGNTSWETPASGNTFYTGNGAFNSDRTVSGADVFYLWFLGVNSYIFQTSETGPDRDFGAWFDIEENNILAGGKLFKVRKRGGVGVGVDRFAILRNGQIEINEEFRLPLNDGTPLQVLATDGAGNVDFYDVKELEAKNIGSNQWSVTAPLTVLPTGQTANGISFFTEANKVTSGTTSYDEYFLSWGRTLTLTGTNGTANVNILGVNYLATFNTSLTLTASDFVTAHQTTLNALGIQVFAIAGVLRFGSLIQSQLNAITITTLTGNLSGTFNTAINDHIVIPYVGRPYEGQRLQHAIRVNFNINVGSNNFYALSLRRWADDSQIGSTIIIERNADYTGQQHVFLSYTSGPTDPFVTGGFYFAFFNNSGQNVEVQGNAGILIQTTYERPTKF